MCKKLIYLTSFFLVLSLVLVSGAKAADPNLVGWWPLNEGSGDVATDLSGSGNDGMIGSLNGGLGLDGSVWVDDPVRGTVISFNGTSEGAYVRAGEIPQMTLTNDFTWAFWAKHSDENTADNDIILGNRMDENAVDFVPRQFIKFTPTKFEWHMNGNGDDNLDYDDIPADVWIHHAVVKTADQLTYYRNGIEASSGTFTQPLDFPQPLYFGGDNEGSEGENWAGLMSDVRIYNRAVTGLEIVAAMEGVEQVDMEIGFATPVIDGEVDYVWEGASTHNMVPLDDPADASGSWKLLYDSDNLYVIVDVTDDILQNDSASSWQDDSVEIYFDGGNTKLDTALSGDDHQYTFGWTTDEIQGTNIDGATDGIEHAQVDTGTGWRIEIKLPWLSIQGAAPQARDLIGIDCYYNDDDDGGDSREGKMLSFSAVEGWNDASQWGTAVLAVIPEPVDPGVEGLVAHYEFENDANDSSGNGLHGTTVGDPSFVEGLSGHGMALDLDGSDDLVELGKFDVVGGITLAAWIRADDFEINDARIISKANEWSEDNHLWMLSTISETSLRFRLKTDEVSSTATLVSGPVLEAGVFAHVAATWDGSSMRIFKDGVEVASQEKGGFAVAVDPDISAAIGSQPSDAFASDPSHVVKFFDGLIDDVRIYDRALSEGEVLYLAGERAAPDVEANKEVARRFFEEMWNLSDLDIVEELISADMQGHAPTGEFVGYEGERQTILGTLEGIPDLQITIDEMIAEDNKVALLTSYHGTHTGTLMGQIPPTGAEVHMTGAILFHFADGKIVEAWSFADMLGLMQQIGVTSPPRPKPEDYAWLPFSELTGDPGDPETNKTMVTRFVEEVWNQRNLDPIAELFHPESFGNNPAIDYLYMPFMPLDRDAFKQSISDYLTAYPDMYVTIHDMVAEGDKVLAHWSINATHGGELMGIPPTGNPVTFSGHTMYRFADGQIVESWWAWDTMGMMQQIMPPGP